MSEFEDAEIVSESVISHAVSEISGNPHQLEIIVKESGLVATKAEIILAKFKNYFELASEWERKARSIIVTDASQEFEIQQARAGRLLLRQKRLDVEKTRKELKEQALREGKAIDGIANVLKGLIEPIEEYLDKQERFVQIQQAKKAEADRIENERKAEIDRLEKDRLDSVERFRRESCLPYKQFWKSENPSFREMPDDDFKKMLNELKSSKDHYDKEQEKIRLENERLKQEQIAANKKADEERKAAEAKAAAERAEAQRKLDEERAKAKAEKDAADKKAAAERKKIEDAAKADREKKLAEIAKKNAELAKAKEIADRARAEAERLRGMLTCPKCGHRFNNQKEEEF